LSNYDIEKNGKYTGKWYTSIQYGNGKGFPIQHIEDNFFPELEGIINSVKCGNQFLNRINNGFSEKIASSNILQDLYEKQESSVLFLEPTELFDTLNDILQGLNNESKLIKQGENRVFEFKDEVPINQFFALYAINKISTIANGN
jgi:DNA (cytosine-5)-methyltransferase 1